MGKKIMTTDAMIQQGYGLIMPQLTKYEAKINEPLFASTWPRDITPISAGPTMAEYSAFNRVEYSSAESGSLGTIGGQTTEIIEPKAEPQFTFVPTKLFAQNKMFPYIELERSRQTDIGPRFEELVVKSIQRNYDVFIQQLVYFGDPKLKDFNGLLNHQDPHVVTAAPVNGNWMSADASNMSSIQGILDDINFAINTVWDNCASDISAIPNQILIPTAAYAKLVGTIVSQAGNISVLTFLEQNNIAKAQGVDLKILPLRQALKAGVGGVDRMVVYRNETDFVRFSMFQPLKAIETAWNPEKMGYETSFIANIGGVELVYPETMMYVDGVM